MSFVLSQVAVQRIIQTGLANLKNDRTVFEEIFNQYCHPALINDYGQDYIDNIWDWFYKTRIPVVQAWALNKTRIPSISIHLAQEMEDESKAAIGDVFGIEPETGDEIGTGVFTVNIDIGLHADKTGDEVLWLYYIMSYILFNNKRLAEELGIKLHTFNGSDYGKKMEVLPENIWTRWIRFRCTVENMWIANKAIEITEANTGVSVVTDSSETSVRIGGKNRDEATGPDYDQIQIDAD